MTKGRREVLGLIKRYLASHVIVATIEAGLIKPDERVGTP
jgi:hypothetical protein